MSKISFNNINFSSQTDSLFSELDNTEMFDITKKTLEPEEKPDFSKVSSDLFFEKDWGFIEDFSFADLKAFNKKDEEEESQENNKNNSKPKRRKKRASPRVHFTPKEDKIIMNFLKNKERDFPTNKEWEAVANEINKKIHNNRSVRNYSSVRKRANLYTSGHILYNKDGSLKKERYYPKLDIESLCDDNNNSDFILLLKESRKSHE